MTGTEALVLDAIAKTTKADGWSYATNRQLGEVAGLTSSASDGRFRSVHRAIENLANAQVVEVRYDRHTGDRMVRVRTKVPEEAQAA